MTLWLQLTADTRERVCMCCLDQSCADHVINSPAAVSWQQLEVFGRTEPYHGLRTGPSSIDTLESVLTWPLRILIYRRYGRQLGALSSLLHWYTMSVCMTVLWR